MSDESLYTQTEIPWYGLVLAVIVLGSIAAFFGVFSLLGFIAYMAFEGTSFLLRCVAE